MTTEELAARMDAAAKLIETEAEAPGPGYDQSGYRFMREHPVYGEIGRDCREAAARLREMEAWKAGQKGVEEYFQEVERRKEAERQLAECHAALLDEVIGRVEGLVPSLEDDDYQEGYAEARSDVLVLLQQQRKSL